MCLVHMNMKMVILGVRQQHVSTIGLRFVIGRKQMATIPLSLMIVAVCNTDGHCDD